MIDAFPVLEQVFKEPTSFGVLNLSRPVYLDTPFGAVDPATGEPFFFIPENPLYPEGIPPISRSISTACLSRPTRMTS